MKLKTSLEKRCPYCYISKKNNIHYIKCKKFKRHRQKHK